MRRISLGLLILGGFAAAGWGWRSATQAGRRVSELLELVRGNEGKSGSGWSERDAKRFWDGVDWFMSRDPQDLGRRIAAAIREGPEQVEAARLIVGLHEFQYVRRSTVPLVENRILPPPPTLPGNPSVFNPVSFRFPRLVLDDALAVDRLAGQTATPSRMLLVHLLWVYYAAPSHAWEAAARMAERDPDLDLRVEAMRVLAEQCIYYPQVSEPVLARLAEDAEPVIRLAALGALAEAGNAQRAREFVFALMQMADPGARRRGAARVIRVPESLPARSNLALELMGYLLAGPAGVTPEGWELAERFGNVLERRAVGEYDDPVVPENP